MIFPNKITFLFLAAIFFFLFDNCFSQPKISVREGTKLELGVVNGGDTVVKRLTLKNIGSDTLRIASVRTSCGCTVVEPTVKQLAPNDSTSLIVKFDTKEFVGPVKKEVYIFSNDSSNEKFTITLLATVRRLIEAEPRYINFYQVETNIVTSKRVVLRNTSDSTIQILSVASPDSQFTFKPLLTIIIEPHGEASLFVSLKPSKKGKILGQIALKTNNSKLPEFTISYIAYTK